MAKDNSALLFTALTDLLPTGRAVEMNGKLKAFSTHLNQAGIGAPAANAMANVIGLDKSSWFRLWDVKRNPAAPASSSTQGYEADGADRYFFEYGTPPGGVIILEYSRFERFELRGSQIAEEGWKELKFSDGLTREAVAAMLFAIMLEESNAGPFSTTAINFSREYQAGFPCGPDQGMNIINALYGELRDNTDPGKAKERDTAFKLNGACVSKQTGRLKRLLEGEKIGYTRTDNTRVYFASDVEAALLKKGGNAEEIPQSFVILDGVLATRKRGALKIEPGMFPINPDRVVDGEDRPRLLEIPDWYVPVPAVMNIAKAVAGSVMFDRPFRNILMRGPAGSGKTEGAKALSAMFGLPYGVVTGHAELEFFDLTSNLFPNTDSAMNTPEELYEFLLYVFRDGDRKLPRLIEIASMPEEVLEEFTGKAGGGAVSEQECLSAIVSRLLLECRGDSKLYTGENSKFKVVNSDLTQGFQKGWCVELQEMNVVLKPGVLVGLNNILEHGQLRLPTGEVIRRHPDTVIVFTQNVGYAGTTDGNQSVYSRIEVKVGLDHPTEDEMIGRIRMHVPNISEADCRTIVQTVLRVQENCASEIEGGSAGTREAINWAKMTVLLGGDMRAAAEMTLLPSVGEDEDDIAVVRTNIHQSIAEV